MHDTGSGHAVDRPVTLRDALVTEAAVLSDLALRSKAVWGYSPEFMERCRPLLTITPDYIAMHTVVVAERGGAVAGFHALVQHEPGMLSLDLCYVDPQQRGAGVGQALLRDAVERATARACMLYVESDPNAEAFYARHGGVREGEVESPAEAGRMLPVLLFRTVPGAP